MGKDILSEESKIMVRLVKAPAQEGCIENATVEAVSGVEMLSLVILGVNNAWVDCLSA